MAARAGAAAAHVATCRANTPHAPSPRRRCRGPRHNLVVASRVESSGGGEAPNPEPGSASASGRRALLLLAASPALRAGAALAAGAAPVEAAPTAALSPLRTPLSVAAGGSPYVSLSWLADTLRRGDVAEAFFTDARTVAFRTRRPVADYEARPSCKSDAATCHPDVTFLSHAVCV